MSRHAHRVRWIGRADVPGRWCRACWTFAPNLRAQLTHADVHEPGVQPTTDGAPLDEETNQ